MAIVWPSIGGYYFVSLEGDISPKGVTVEEITRPGVNGRAFRSLGERGGETVLFGVAVAGTTSTLADALLSTYKGLQASLVTIVQAEISRSNYLVLEVDGFARQKIANPVGGLTASGGALTGGATYWLVYSRWVVVYGGT